MGTQDPDCVIRYLFTNANYNIIEVPVVSRGILTFLLGGKLLKGQKRKHVKQRLIVL